MLFMHIYSKKCHFKANVAKCAMVVFRNENTFGGEWFWVDSALPYLN